MVEVEPITCWWRTSTSAVRTGESFGLTLTCAVVETEANKVVPDLSKLDPTVGAAAAVRGAGRHARRRSGRRRASASSSTDYRLRLIAEDAFGNDVDDSAARDFLPHREQGRRRRHRRRAAIRSYSLPRASVRAASRSCRTTPATFARRRRRTFTGDREPRFARQPAADRRRHPVRARRRRGDRRC